MKDHSDTLPLVAVIIVNYNTFDDARRCIESILAQPPQLARLKIVLVDNASTDNSAEGLRQLFPQIQVIANKENLGFSCAANQGLRSEPAADFFLLLNPDTLILTNPQSPTPNPIDSMLEFLQTHPDAGAVGCRLLLTDGTTQISYGRFPSPLTYITDHSLLHPLRILLRRLFVKLKVKDQKSKIVHIQFPAPKVQPPVEVDWLMGACILLPAEVIQRVGFFDEGFFMYAEDTDLCYRIRHSGKKIYYLPWVFLYHYHKRASRKLLEFTFFELFRSLLLYHQKHSSFAIRFITRIIIFADMLFRLFVYGSLWLITLGKNSAGHPQRFRATLRVLKLLFIRECSILEIR